MTYKQFQEEREKAFHIFIDTLPSRVNETPRNLLKQFFSQDRIALLEMVIKDVERLQLEKDVVICDCGLPYKDSDLGDYIDKLSKDLQSMIEEERRRNYQIKI